MRNVSKLSDKYRPIIWGRDISKYHIDWSGQFINYDTTIAERISLEDIKSKHGMNKQNRIDFALRSTELFEFPKIVIRKTGDSLIASYDNTKYYFDTLVHGIYQVDEKFKLKSLLTILNSKPATVFYRLLHDIKGKVFAKISLDNLASFPIPNLKYTDQQPFIEKADLMLSLNKELQEVSQKFQRTISRKFNLTELPKKLQDWYQLSYGEFIKELAKKKVKLSLGDKAEWEDYFTEQAQKALALKNRIEATDAKIDRLVYALYGLTEEEIALVEGREV